MRSSGRDNAALTGVLFVVLVLVAFIVLGGNTPDGDAKAAKVVSFYTAHDQREILASVVLALSTIPLLYFSARLRQLFTAGATRPSALPAFTFGAGVAAAAGFMVNAGIHFTLADYANNIEPVALQAINALDSDDFLLLTTGLAGMVLGASLLTLRGGVLPKWLGWVGVVLFVVFFTPAGFLAFGLTGLWIIIVSVMLYLRGTPDAQPLATTPA